VTTSIAIGLANLVNMFTKVVIAWTTGGAPVLAKADEGCGHERRAGESR